MLELELNIQARAPHQSEEEEQIFSQTLIYPKDFQGKSFLEQCDRLAYHISRRCTSDAIWNGTLRRNNEITVITEHKLSDMFMIMFKIRKEIDESV